MIFILENPATDHPTCFPEIEGAYKSEIEVVDSDKFPSQMLPKDFQNTWLSKGFEHEKKYEEGHLFFSRKRKKEVWLIDIPDLEVMEIMLRKQYKIFHANHEIAYREGEPYPTLRINNVY